MRKKIEKNFWDMEIIGNRRKKKIFALKKLKKPPQKVAYLSRNSAFQKFLNYCSTAETAKIMFQNVAYRAIIYRTGVHILPEAGN